eukprot:TRINITY_DN23940_c0_g1_i1.p2 TRINITY_DN23940_c0_g1~~TRINITY_DN23940_c0_g1_i1.p2  ORF type:complete len:142 (-),score=21.00 TRINITY_DN23940_c0_g1_i1:619-1044(-)
MRDEKVVFGTIVATALVVGAASALVMWRPRLKRSTVKHLFVAKFKGDLAATDIARQVEGFKTLCLAIPTVKGFEWGTVQNNDETSRGYTHVFALEFTDKEGLKYYIDHNLHQGFAKEIVGACDEFAVLDFSPNVESSPHYS